VRDVERRIQRRRADDAELPVVEQPLGIPDTFDAAARLMYDLLALAFQCDLTRVGTFMIGQGSERAVVSGELACRTATMPARITRTTR